MKVLINPHEVLTVIIGECEFELSVTNWDTADSNPPSTLNVLLTEKNETCKQLNVKCWNEKPIDSQPLKHFNNLLRFCKSLYTLSMKVSDLEHRLIMIAVANLSDTNK
jgi:hypothetical protein